MIDIVLFQLLRATVFLAAGFPVVRLLIRFGRLRSALEQRFAWGALLAVSLLCMTVPLRIPVNAERSEVAATPPSTETVEMPNAMDRPVENVTPIQPGVIPIVVEQTVDLAEPHGISETISSNVFGMPSQATAFVGLFGIWTAGLLIVWGRRVLAWFSLQQLLRAAPIAADHQWSTLLKRYGVSQRIIPLRLTESTGPALVRDARFGLSLIVPEPLWEELSPELREGVLRHELGHYLHGDTIFSPLMYFLASLQWFNPFAWLVLRRYDEATEWHVDQFAYGERPSGSSELAETFLAIHRSTESLGLYLNGFSRFSTLDRVNRLLPDSKKEHFMKKIVIGAVLALLLCGGLFRVQLVARQASSGEKITHRCFVKDKNGKPIVGAKTIIRLLSGRKDSWHVKPEDIVAEFRLTTGMDGGCDFTVTKEQSEMPDLYFFLTAAHPDYISTGFWFDSYREFVEKQKIRNEKDRWTLELDPSAPASGTVVTPEGKPAADVLVFTFSQDERYINGAKTVTRTDTNGKFRIGLLPAENRWVWILPNDFAPLSLSLKKDETDLGTLRLQHGVVLEGRFLDRGKPVENLWVSMWPKGTPAAKAQGHDAACRDAVTDKDGRFRMNPLMPGEYVFTTGMLMEYDRHNKMVVPESAYANNCEPELWLGKPVAQQELPDQNTDVPFAETTVTLTDSPRQRYEAHSTETVALTIRPVGTFLQGREKLTWIVSGRLNESNVFERKAATANAVTMRIPKGSQHDYLKLADDVANRYYPLRFRLIGDEKWSNNWYALFEKIDKDTTIEAEPYEPALLKVACRKPDGTPLEQNNIRVKYSDVEFSDPVTITVDGGKVGTGIERHSPEIEFAVMEGKTVMWRYRPVLADEEFTLLADGFDDESWFEPVRQTLRLKSGETKEMIVPLQKRVEKKKKDDLQVHWTTVLDDETGKPLVGVAATLKYPVKGEEKPKSMTTKSDAQGRVFFTRLTNMDLDKRDEPKPCSLELEREKYVPMTRSLLPKHVDENINKQKYVFSDCRMIHATVVTGRLVSEDGKPVSGAKVMLDRNRMYDNPRRSVGASQTLKSSEDGSFTVFVGKFESANLQIRAKNFALKRFFIKDADDQREQIDWGDVVMSPGFRPSVQVLDKDGKPVEDVWANLSLVCTTLEEEAMKTDENSQNRRYSMSDGGIFALTDSKGVAEFEPIEAGAYSLGIVDYPGWPLTDTPWTSKKRTELFKPIKGVFEKQAARFTPETPTVTIKAQKTVKVEVRFSDKQTNAHRENWVWIQGQGTSIRYPGASLSIDSRYTGKYRGDGVFVFEVPDQLRGAKLILKQANVGPYVLDNEISYRCHIDGKEVFPPGYPLEFPIYPLYGGKVIELTCCKSPKIVLHVVDEDGKPFREFYAGAQYARRAQEITFKQNDEDLTSFGYGYRGATTSSRSWGYTSSEYGGGHLGMDVEFVWRDPAKDPTCINYEGILPGEDLQLYVVAKGYQVSSQKIAQLAEGEERELTVTVEKIPED